MSLKVIFVGQENVGKSSLIAGIKTFLTGGKKNYKKLIHASGGLNQGTTQGIHMEDLQLQLDHSTKLQVKIWDFAGLEAFQTTHSFFITNRSIFVIVWNIQAKPENSRVDHWLKTIRFHAKDSRILLVATHLDTLPKKKKETVRKIKEDIEAKYSKTFPQISDVHGVGVRTGVGMDVFVASLVKHIQTAIEPYRLHPDPKSCTDFAKAIIAIREHKSTLWQRSTPVCEWRTVTKIFNKLNIPPTEWAKALTYAEEIGVCVYCRGSEVEVGGETENRAQGFVILNPEWITEMFAMIIWSGRTESVNGILDMETLKNHIWIPTRVPTNIHAQLLRVLEGFGIVFPFPDGSSILVPSLLGDSHPNHHFVWPAHNPFTIQFNRYYQFKFVPSGLFYRFLIRILSLSFKTFYWSKGIILDNGDSLCFIENLPMQNLITISARSQRKDRNPVVVFISVINLFDHLLENHFKVTATIGIPCPMCISTQMQEPTLFRKKDVEATLAANNTIMVCDRDSENPHEVPLYIIAPDIAMIDFENKRIDIAKSVKIVGDRPVGEGAFAMVWKGEFKGKVVAIKKMNVDPSSKKPGSIEALAEFRREVRVMCRLKHHNLVQIMGFSLSHPMTMVMEFCPFGDLYNLLHNQNIEINWSFRLRVAWDISMGMTFLHGTIPAIVHRDLKTPNVMIVSTDSHAPVCAKVADFGISKELLTEHFKAVRAAQRDVVNPTWLAPEVMCEEVSGKPMDVYPFGIILWELLTRQHPFGNYKFTFNQEEAIINGERPTIPEDCPENYKNLIVSCWQRDPSFRPSYSTISTQTIPALIRELSVDLLPIIMDFKSATEYRKTRMSNGILPVHPAVLNRRMARSAPKKAQINGTTIAFIPKTSINIINRWKPNGRIDFSRDNLVRSVDDNLLHCPFPGDISDSEWEQLSEELEPFKDRYKIYNLSGLKYDYSKMFEGIVVEYPLDEFIPPIMTELKAIIDDIFSWINQSAGNTALVHCHGKDSNRSGLVIAGTLLKVHNVNSECALDVIEKALFIRFKIPSFRRYLSYFSHGIFKGFPQHQERVYLHKIKFNSIPNFKLTGGCDPHYAVLQNGKKIFFSKKLKGRKEKDPVEFFCGNLLVGGDIRIEFYHKNYTKLMFSVSLNTAFEVPSRTIPEGSKPSKTMNVLVFEKDKLDQACNDNKHFQNYFKLEIYYIRDEQIRKVRSRANAVRGRSKAWNGNNVPIIGKKIGRKISEKVLLRKTISGKKPSKAKLFECALCKKSITENEISIELVVGFTVHYECLACSKCGRTLHDNSLQSLVREDKVICSECDVTFFPSCVACKKNISGPVAKIESESWHPACFKCSVCSVDLYQKPYKFINNSIQCACCGKDSEENLSPPPKAPTVEEDDLDALLSEKQGREHFRKHLIDNKAENLLDFWEKVDERKENASKNREIIGMKLLEDFVASGKSTSLPEKFVVQTPKIEDLKEENCFDGLQKLVFSEMASEFYPTFIKGDGYEQYLKEIRSIPDFSDQQDALRQEITSDIFPIQTDELLPCERIAHEQAKEILEIQEKNDTNFEALEEAEFEMRKVEALVKSSKDVIAPLIETATSLFSSTNQLSLFTPDISTERRKSVMEIVTKAHDVSQTAKQEAEILNPLIGKISMIFAQIQPLENINSINAKMNLAHIRQTGNALSLAVQNMIKDIEKIQSISTNIELNAADMLSGVAKANHRSPQTSRQPNTPNKTNNGTNNILDLLKSSLLTIASSAKEIREIKQNNILKFEKACSKLQELCNVPETEVPNALTEVMALTKDIHDDQVSAAASLSVGQHSFLNARSALYEIKELTKSDHDLIPYFEQGRDLLQKAIKANESQNMDFEVISSNNEKVQLEQEKVLKELQNKRTQQKINDNIRNISQLLQDSSAIVSAISRKKENTLSSHNTNTAAEGAREIANLAFKVAGNTETIQQLFDDLVKLFQKIGNAKSPKLAIAQSMVQDSKDLMARALKDATTVRDFTKDLQEIEKQKSTKESNEKIFKLLPNCMKCGLKLAPGQRYVSQPPYNFHTECFRCNFCKVLLEKQQFITEGLSNSQPKQAPVFWCIPDYCKFKAPKCSACYGPILAANFLRAAGSCFHEDCLFCFKCKRKLKKDAFYLVDNLPCCSSCEKDL